MLRAKSELESIADLRAATAPRDRTMQAWLRLRSRLIAHACRAHAGPEPERAASVAARALTVIERWGASPASRSEMARTQHRLEIESNRGNIRAARLALGTRAGRRKGWPDRPRGVGEASVISPHEAGLLVASLGAFGELRLRHPGNAYRGARRFPVRASRDFGRAAHGGGLVRGDALSVLDRVDVLTSVVQRVDAPVANLLVGRAHALIGHVVRDKAAIRRLVEDLSRHPTLADKPRLLDAIVALGLLGAEPLAPDYWTDASADRARAHVLALALATLDRRRTLSALRDMLERRQEEMPARTRGVFVAAVQALRAGVLIGLLEAHQFPADPARNTHGSD